MSKQTTTKLSPTPTINRGRKPQSYLPKASADSRKQKVETRQVIKSGAQRGDEKSKSTKKDKKSNGEKVSSTVTSKDSGRALRTKTKGALHNQQGELRTEIGQKHESDHSSLDHSSITGISDSCVTLGFSEPHMRVSAEELAKNSELLFGFNIPHVKISDDNEDELFEAVATKVDKWKMFGRYLGLKDTTLDDIEVQNHFAGERCLKVLRAFKKEFQEEATYITLASALKDTMNNQVVMDVSSYFPSLSQPLTEDEFPVLLTSDPNELKKRLNRLQECFEVHRNHGRQQANLRFIYNNENTVDSRSGDNQPLCFQLMPLDKNGFRVVHELCIAASQRRVKEVTIQATFC